MFALGALCAVKIPVIPRDMRLGCAVGLPPYDSLLKALSPDPGTIFNKFLICSICCPTFDPCNSSGDGSCQPLPICHALHV